MLLAKSGFSPFAFEVKKMTVILKLKRLGDSHIFYRSTANPPSGSNLGAELQVYSCLSTSAGLACAARMVWIETVITAIRRAMTDASRNGSKEIGT